MATTHSEIKTNTTVAAGTYSVGVHEDYDYGVYKVSDNAVLSLSDGVTFEGSTIKVKGDKISNAGGGAGIRLTSGTVTGSNAIFSNNRTRYGAAISSDDSAKTCIDLTGSTFTGNKAFHGGAIHTAGDNTTTLTDCYFTNNETLCEYGGGAIFFEGSNAMNLIDCTFSNNLCKTENTGAEVAGNGGAICGYTGAGTITIRDCHFLTEHDTISAGSSIEGGNFSGTINLTGNLTLNAKFYIHHGSIKATDALIDTNQTTWDTAFSGVTSSTLHFNTSMGATTTVSCSIANFNVISLAAGKTLNFTAYQILTASNSFKVSTDNSTSRTVGSQVTLTTGGKLSNVTSASMIMADGSTTSIVGGTESIAESLVNGLGLYTDNRLKAVQGIKSLLADSGTTIGFEAIADGKNLDFSSATLGANKTITGNGTTSTLLKGTLDTDGHSLSMDNLKYSGTIYGSSEGIILGGNTATLLANNSRIYGGGSFSASDTFQGATTTVTTAIDGKARIYGGCDVTTESGNITGSGNIVNTINITGGTGVLYGGARVAGNGSGTYEGTIDIGTITTTIKGGSFTGYAGNGSQVQDGTVNHGFSTLTIENGNFDNVVYAGAYSQGTDAMVTVAGTKLNISGGTFEKMVFGGCAANTNKQARSTKVVGDVNVTVTGGTTAIDFKRHLIAGSQSCKNDGVSACQVTGNATITFTGSGDNISFDNTSYVIGGSQLDGQKGVDSIGGTSTLVFDEFTASDFAANFDNTFNAVKFSGSSVTFTGGDVKLSKVSTWDFDVSDAITDLTWTNGVNNFAGDTINLRDWDGSSDRIFMTGSNATLKGWNDGTTHINVYTAATPETKLESGYYIKRDGNNLLISATPALS